MFNRITLAFSFFIIVLLHYSFLNAVPLKNEVISQISNPKVFKIALKKVKITQKEIKKVLPSSKPKEIVKNTQKVKPKIKKIVKKAKRKIQKTVKKTIPKRVIKKKIVKKEIKKVQKKEQVKLVQTMTKKIIQKEKPLTDNANPLKNVIKNEYLSKIKSHIEKYKKYPRRAKRLNQQGKVVVSFKIEKNGQIKDIEIKSRCPFKKLNIAAINILKEIAQFDPIPNELNKNSWDIEVPISYSIINS